jgi:hypothetical protein
MEREEVELRGGQKGGKIVSYFLQTAAPHWLAPLMAVDKELT